MKVKIEFHGDPETKLELDCGNFGVERAPIHDGGPIVVTLIDSDNKQDPSANILGMYVGVSRITLVNNDPYTAPPQRGRHAVAASGRVAARPKADEHRLPPPALEEDPN